MTEKIFFRLLHALWKRRGSIAEAALAEYPCNEFCNVHIVAHTVCQLLGAVSEREYRNIGAGVRGPCEGIASV